MIVTRCIVDDKFYAMLFRHLAALLLIIFCSSWMVKPAPNEILVRMLGTESFQLKTQFGHRGKTSRPWRKRNRLQRRDLRFLPEPFLIQ